MTAPFPIDVWGAIADLAPGALRGTCRVLDGLVRHRFVSIGAHRRPIVLEDDDCPDVSSLRLEPVSLQDPTLQEAVRLLPTMIHLRTLDLRLPTRAPKTPEQWDAIFALLACFGSLPVLDTLHMNLAMSSAGDELCAAVATALPQCPLRNVHLGLSSTATTARGVAALVTGLLSLRTLREVHLGLSFTGIGDAGAAAVSELRRAPFLESLSLQAVRCGITTTGALALSELRGSPRLRSLRLNLSANAIDDEGARSLAPLGELPGLLSLHLFVKCNPTGAAGASALGVLRHEPPEFVIMYENQDPLPPPDCV
jgi:hypothetical protein